MTPTSAPGQELLAWHLGALHPVEQLLTVLLAFGPFLLLGLVIVVRRRQDAREAADEPQVPGGPEVPGEPGGPAQRER